MSVSASLSAGEGVVAPLVAYNVEHVVDWSVQLPFLDIAKTLRAPVVSLTDGTLLTLEQLQEAGYADENGWLTSMPENFQLYGAGWGWNQDTAESIAGTYVLTYEGEGSIRLIWDAKIISSEPGRIVFVTEGKNNASLQITETDPNGTGEYIRNISIVREDYVELYEAGAVFNPEFISMLEDARQIRFMDWMRTNNSNLAEWSDRAEVGDLTWATEAGVPVEIMVALANQVGADPWFTIPHDATEEYVREFATYVRDHLDTRLKASVEFSNETWNWAFRQIGDLRYDAIEDWDLAADDWHPITIDYQVKRMTETALIWDDVFGDEAGARLVKVMAVQAVNAWRTKHMLDPTVWFEKEPDTAVNPADVFDALAVTTYFGYSITSNDDLRAQLLAAIADPEVDAQLWLRDMLLDPSVRSSIPDVLAALAEQKALAEAHGLDLIAYEGGQHVHQHVGGDDGTISDFMIAFVRSEAMGELYEVLWEGWSEVGDGAFMQFNLMGGASKWGSWGLYTSFTDDNPRAQAIEELARTAEQWWEETRAEGAFLHGVTREGGEGDDHLYGTLEEDFLLGGAGDDLLYGGASDDGLHGGEGVDTALFSGSAADYEIAAEDTGWSVEGLDGVDLLVDIEFMRFASGEVLELLHPERMIIPQVALEARAEVAGHTSCAIVEGDVFGIEGLKLAYHAINRYSALGQELAAQGVDVGAAYVIFDPTATAEIGGVQIAMNYDSLQENRTADGAITQTALETATQIATIVTGVSSLHGTSRGESFLARAGDDRIFGAGGADWIQGGQGSDVLNGGDGADTFVFARGDGRDVIEDFSAEDRLQLRNFADLGTASEALRVDETGMLVFEHGDDRLDFANLGAADYDMVAAWILAA